MKRIPYEKAFGEVSFPEGFAETLLNLTLEEQMDRYRTTASLSVFRTPWRRRQAEKGCKGLGDTPEVRGLIVKEGLLVGVLLLDDTGRQVPCLAEEGVCTYCASDNNGAGYKTREDYIYLVCVPSAAGK